MKTMACKITQLKWQNNINHCGNSDTEVHQFKVPPLSSPLPRATTANTRCSSSQPFPDEHQFLENKITTTLSTFLGNFVSPNSASQNCPGQRPVTAYDAPSYSCMGTSHHLLRHSPHQHLGHLWVCTTTHDTAMQSLACGQGGVL